MTLKKFERGQTVHDRAAHIWQVLVPWVTWKMQVDGLEPGLITYGRLAQELGFTPQAGRTFGRPLGAIAAFCSQNGLPALNAVVVRKDTEMAGDGVVTAEFEDPQVEAKAVLSHDWRAYKMPTPRQFRTAAEEELDRLVEEDK